MLTEKNCLTPKVNENIKNNNCINLQKDARYNKDRWRDKDMKKNTTAILSVFLICIIFLVNSTVSQGGFLYDSDTPMLTVKEIDGEWYLYGDIYFNPNGGNTRAEWSAEGIFTVDEREKMGMSDRYLCVGGYLYDIEYVERYEGSSCTARSLDFPGAKCGTLQGFLNTGSYYCWDTEPVENPVVKLPGQETVEPEPQITITEMSAVMYATKDCNVRNGGSTSFDKIGSLTFNQEVMVTGKTSTNWYRIVYNDGEGFVSGTLLTDTKYVEPEVIEPPVEEPPVEEVPDEPEVIEPPVEEEPEVVIPDNRLFEDLNEEALTVLGQLIELDDYDATISVLATAEHKTLPVEILSKIRSANKEVVVKFVEEDGETLYYSCTIDNVLDEIPLDLSYERKRGTLGTVWYPKTNNVVLDYQITLKLQMEESNYPYHEHIHDSAGYMYICEKTTDAEGYLEVTTQILTEFTYADRNLTEPIEEPEVEVEEVVTEPEPEKEVEYGFLAFVKEHIVFVTIMGSILAVAIITLIVLFVKGRKHK